MLCLALAVRRRAFEQVALRVREDRSRFVSCCLAAEHLQPCYPLGDDAAKRNAAGQAIGSVQTQLFDAAAGLQGLEESLNLPAQGVSLARGVRVVFYRQVCDQFPVDRRPAFRWVELFSMDDLQILVPVTLLLSDRRADSHRGMPDRQHGARSLPYASRNRTSRVPLDGSFAITLAMVVLPSSASRSTQLRTWKFFPSSSAKQ